MGVVLNKNIRAINQRIFVDVSIIYSSFPYKNLFCGNTCTIYLRSAHLIYLFLKAGNMMENLCLFLLSSARYVSRNFRFNVAMAAYFNMAAI